MPIEPLYRKIMRDIREKIASGEYTPDAPLPSTRELAEIYNVTRTTVRVAVNILLETGELTGHQGKGVYVAQQQSESRSRESFTENG